MRALLRIARTELAVLFYSPIAWLLLIVFIVQASMAFVRQIGSVAGSQLAGYGGFSAITEQVFSTGFGGTFRAVQENLLYYIPLLSMGLISRELHSGSVKLLLSSPISLSQIIVGKYLAMMAYFLLFVLFLLGLMAALSLNVNNVDYPLVLSGILGIYLLACAYAAIGLFMSSLTMHQVVAAISTLAVLAILGITGSIGQRVPLLDDFAYWLSISGRVDYLREGLIATKDVAYFIAIIVLFLVFTYLKLSAGRRIESRLLQSSKYAAVLLVVGVFGYLTSLPAVTGYLDATREDKMTLAAGSQDVMAGVKGPWSVTVYANVLDRRMGSFLPQSRNYYQRVLFDQFVRESAQMEFEYVYYYAPSENELLYEAYPGESDAQIAQRLAEQQRFDFATILSTDQMNAILDMVPENYRNIYKLDWDGQSAVIRNFDDVLYLPDEVHFSAAFRRLSDGAKTIAYVTGNGERSVLLKGMQDHQKFMSERTFRYAMINFGFETAQVSLEEAVPANVDILVLAAPREPLSPAETHNLSNYIKDGRNLMVMAEPSNIGLMNDIVRNWGVEFVEGRVVEPKDSFPEDTVFAKLASKSEEHGFDVPGWQQRNPLVMTGVAALRILDSGLFDVSPVVVIDPESGTASLETSTDATLNDTALGLLLSRPAGGKEQRIMVVGDADFMSTATLSSDTRKINGQFLEDTMRWLSNGTHPVDVSRPDPIDTHINLDLKGVDRLKVLFYGIIPGLLTLFAAQLLYRRRAR